MEVLPSMINIFGLQMSASPAAKAKGQSLAMMPGESLDAVAQEQRPGAGGAAPLPADYQDDLQPRSAARVSQQTAECIVA